MTREEVIRMATQAGWEMPTQWDSDDGFLVRLERFANLVAAAENEACLNQVEILVEAEREACARVVEQLGRGHSAPFAEYDCAEAIRARGNDE